jgi:hypothetical protein
MLKDELTHTADVLTIAYDPFHSTHSVCRAAARERCLAA